MAQDSFFANNASLNLTIGATSVSVAALKNVSFTPKYEIAELYGMESTHVKARNRYQLKVDTKVEYAIWDPDLDYMLFSFLNGEYKDPTGVATDSDAAGLRSKCALFNITATVYNTSRTRTTTATAYNVVFPEIPFEMRENEYIVRNLAGQAESVAYATATVA
jgi:hypothetical protein